MVFQIKFAGHECAARRLLLKQGLKTAEELAVMSSAEVEKAVNAEYESINCGEDWLLIPKDKMDEFVSIVTRIKR